MKGVENMEKERISNSKSNSSLNYERGPEGKTSVKNVGMRNLEDLKKLKRMKMIEDYPDFSLDLNRHIKDKVKKPFKLLSDE